MSHAPKSKVAWHPNASLAVLRARAEFLQTIRAFFAQRHVLEVDTPLLSQGVATDPGLEAFEVSTHSQKRYLQTSPEFAMKRLLAAGSGPIYYLGKAFRKGECGARHNPEFTLLEWYRLGWDHLKLIEELNELLHWLLETPPLEITTYQALFEQYCHIEPHSASVSQLQQIAQQRGLSQHQLDLDKDGWLDFLLTHEIEPHLGCQVPLIVLDYPASQASLSKIRKITSEIQVAERFELYYQGIELANGYHELACAHEQNLRFKSDLTKRKSQGLAELPLDQNLLAALKAGFPACAGVAVGVDRLLMLKLNQTSIEQVLPFAWERA